MLTAAEWVPDGDPSTPRVDLLVRDSNLVDRIEGLRSKRFVDLPKTRQSGFFKMTVDHTPRRSQRHLW